MVVSRRQLLGVVVGLPLARVARSAAQETSRYYVIGYVRTPGSYVLKDGMNVGDALRIAGGVVNGGSESAIQIKRKINEEVVTLTVSITDRVVAGDTIRVLRQI